MLGMAIQVFFLSQGIETNERQSVKWPSVLDLNSGFLFFNQNWHGLRHESTVCRIMHSIKGKISRVCDVPMHDTLLNLT